jgi:hypothetical protein
MGGLALPHAGSTTREANNAASPSPPAAGVLSLAGQAFKGNAAAVPSGCALGAGGARRSNAGRVGLACANGWPPPWTVGQIARSIAAAEIQQLSNAGRHRYSGHQSSGNRRYRMRRDRYRVFLTPKKLPETGLEPLALSSLRSLF